MRVVLYPAFRADALHAGRLADTRSAGSVSLCEAEIISLKGEILSAVPRQMKYPARLVAPQQVREIIKHPASAGA